MYDFLLVTINNYMPTCSILWDMAIQNMHNLELDFSRSLKVKFDGILWDLAIQKYVTSSLTFQSHQKAHIGFLLVNNKYASLQYFMRYIAIQNMHDLDEFDLSRSLKVKVNSAIRKPA